MKKLENKIIIVTGGSGLIGKTIIADIRRNSGTAINADIDCNTDLNKFSRNCDITIDDSIQDTINDVINHFGKLDGLVNNAYPRTKDFGDKFEDTKPDSWRKNVDIHLNSYFVFCQKALSQMKKQGYGSIVNIASIYGIVGPDFTVYEGTKLTNPGVYAAIKGGIINFTRYIASYYGKYNIRANCISPGGIFDNQHERFVKQYEHKVPLKRMGKPEDIAPSVSFLLSNDASYISGHNLVVDGGWTAI